MVDSRLKLGLALLAGGAAVMLIVRNIASAATFSVQVEEVMVEPEDYTGKTVNLEAAVLTDTITQKKGTLEYRFEVVPKQLRDGEEPSPNRHLVPPGKTITVYYGGESGPPPDTLWSRDPKTGYGAEVTLRGSLLENGTFKTTHVTAKCSSKYEVAQPGMAPQPGKAPMGAPMSTK
jgi:cytochrome c-type biogenesis protein CcmE